MLPTKTQNSAPVTLEPDLTYASSTQLARLMIASATQLLAILQIQRHPSASELAGILERLRDIDESIEQEDTISWVPDLLAA